MLVDVLVPLGKLFGAGKFSQFYMDNMNTTICTFLPFMRSMGGRALHTKMKTLKSKGSGKFIENLNLMEKVYITTTSKIKCDIVHTHSHTQ